MPLPKLSKQDWYDPAKRTAVVEAAAALVEDASRHGTDAVARAYAELSALVDRELENGTPVAPPLAERWAAALRLAHEARYGFAPTRVTAEQLRHAIPALAPERLSALSALAGDLADAADGATLGQIANLLVKEAKREGLSVTRAEARRIVAALEGAPIPPR